MSRWKKKKNKREKKKRKGKSVEERRRGKEKRRKKKKRKRKLSKSSTNCSPYSSSRHLRWVYPHFFFHNHGRIGSWSGFWVKRPLTPGNLEFDGCWNLFWCNFNKLLHMLAYLWRENVDIMLNLDMFILIKTAHSVWELNDKLWCMLKAENDVSYLVEWKARCLEAWNSKMWFLEALESENLN